MAEITDGGQAFPGKGRVRVWTKEAMREVNMPDALLSALEDRR